MMKNNCLIFFLLFNTFMQVNLIAQKCCYDEKIYFKSIEDNILNTQNEPVKLIILDGLIDLSPLVLDSMSIIRNIKQNTIKEIGEMVFWNELVKQLKQYKKGILKISCKDKIYKPKNQFENAKCIMTIGFSKIVYTSNKNYLMFVRLEKSNCLYYYNILTVFKRQNRNWVELDSIYLR